MSGSVMRIPFGVTALMFAIGCWARAEEASYPPQASIEQVRAAVEAASREHPRLFATRSELAALAGSVERDPLRKKLAGALVREAERLEGVAPVERVQTGKRLLHVSRECLRRVLVLSMAYHLTGEEEHVRRAEQEMLAAARFSDWNPSHFLDVAEMTLALAIGYDWLHERLDEAAREEIRAAIVEKGVRLQFEGRRGWIKSQNNWGQVCHGGLVAGALAVLEDEPELAARTVHSAITNVTGSMNQFAPRGSYPEGPSYWSYGATYNVLLVDMLEGVLGTDFGLSLAPGFSETGGFLALACGPSGQNFNYADGGAGRRAEPALLWFAARYGRPDWLVGERDRWEKVAAGGGADRLAPLALLWMDKLEPQPPVRLPLHWSSGGVVPITIHRSSWTDPRATFVGLKGGSPSANHGQMDSGSFVLDSDGVRWAIDLGAEDYHGIESRGMELWNNRQDSDRWTIFRLSNQGHNTLVIDERPQVVASNAPIAAFSDDPQRAFSVVDLSATYAGQAKAVRRGVRLLPTGEVLIQDELAGLEPGSRVRWQMITQAEVDVEEHRAVLRQAEKELVLRSLGGGDSRWREIDTARPRNEWDSPNVGTRMIALEAAAPESGALTIAVLATPGSSKDRSVGERPIVRLEEWAEEGEE